MMFRNICIFLNKYKIVILVICITSAALSQVFIPVAFFGPKGDPDLVISDAPSFDFGTLAVNSSTDKTFVVTNTGSGTAATMSGAAFSISEFFYKGGTFPGTGGTCTGALQSGQSCAVVIQTTSAATGTVSSSMVLNYTSITQSYSVSRTVSATYTATVYQLSWVSTPNYIKVNDCQAVTIQRQDSVGNPVTIGSATNITNLLFNNGSNGTYYTSSLCLLPTTTATIAAGTNSVVVYFKSTTSNQTGILVATAAGIISASYNVTITTAPTRLFIDPAPTIKVDACTVVPIYSVDNNYYQSNVGANTTVNLATTGSNIYYSDSGCTSSIASTTLLAGNSLVNVYTKNSSVQAGVTLTASAAGLTASSKVVNFNTSLTWWNSAWTRRMRIQINNSDQASAFTNQPMLVRLTTSNVNYSDIQASGADIRFVDADDTTVLSHQTEEWNYNGTSDLWVKVPNISASSTAGYIYVYFGNPAASDGQSTASVWTNYWAVWHLNESPADTSPQYQDATSNARHGQVKTGSSSNGAYVTPTKELGQLGWAAGLLANDAVQITSSLVPAIGASSTFSCWLRTSQVGNNTQWLAPGLTGVEESGGSNDIFFGWIDATGYIGVTAGNGAATKSSFVVNNNTWRHVTISRNSTSGAVKFYINGVLNTSATSNAGNKTTFFDLLGEIGDTGGTPVNYNGIIDETRIINSVRTDAEVMADFKFMMNTHLIYSSVESGP